MKGLFNFAKTGFQATAFKGSLYQTMIVIHIAGHLGQDPETRYTPSNKKVTTLRVATNIKRGNKEKTVWWRVTVWGDRFDQKLQYLKKGSAVLVIGEMGIPEIYTDKDGNPQTSFEIIADSIIFNPFGGKGGASDRQGRDESDSSEDYGASYQSAKRESGFKGGSSYGDADQGSLRQPGIMQGSGSSTHSSGSNSHSQFDADDDIPF